MAKEKNLGEFEILVLAALVHQGPDAYGVSIRQEIEVRTGQSVSLGAIYATLHRMEKKSYVQSRLGAATSARGGRAKRHYEITSTGRAQFDKSLSVLRNMTDGLVPRPEASA